MRKILGFLRSPRARLGYSLLGSFIAVTAVRDNLLHGFFDAQSGKHIVWLVLFLCLTPVFNRAFSVTLPRTCVTAAVTAALLAVLTVTGRSLQLFSSLWQYTSSPLAFAGFLLRLGGFLALYYAPLVLFFDLALRRGFVSGGRELKCFTNNRRSFFAVWGIIFLCWLPYFLIDYPGNASRDSVTELMQMAGLLPKSLAHPALHTALVGAFYKLGALMGSPTFGVALYSLAQMLIMSAIFSFVIRYFAYRKANKLIRLILLIYFSLFTVNAIYSYTMWKDVLFGGLTLVLFILLTETARRSGDMLLSKKRLTAFILAMFLFCALRNNAVYALILFAPVFIIVYRRYWRSLVAVAVSLVILCSAVNVITVSLLKYERPSAREMLSVPLQQLARTVRDHGGELTENERRTIDEILPIDELSELYIEHISDPVKARLNESVFLGNKARYIALWAELFFKYKTTYIEAFLCNSYGYWYPDVDFWITNDGNAYPFVEGSDGLKVDPGDLESPPSSTLHRLSTGIFPGVPVISMLYSIGFMVWLIIIAAALLILKRRYNMLPPLILLLALWLTTLASPVFAEFRYVYGIILSGAAALPLALRESAE